MNAGPRVSRGRGELRKGTTTDRDSRNDDDYPSSAACLSDGFSDSFSARFAERF